MLLQQESCSLPCMELSCSSSSFHFVRLAAMVTRCFVKVAGTIIVLVCWSSSSYHLASHGLESLQVEQSNKRHCMLPFAVGWWPNTTYTGRLYTFFKYYVREKIWVKHIQFSMQHAVTAVPPLDTVDSRTADHNFWVSTASPLSWKKKCVSNPNNSNVASCLHIDTRHII